MGDNRVEEIDELEEDTQKNKYLTFTLGNESFGIEILFVTEIIGLQQITEVPDLPEYVRGIINLRGKIIPVMDMRRRFKKEIREYDERTCIIVVDIGEISIGLIVDRVSEVVDIPEENVSEPPKVNKNSQNKYVKGIGKIEDSVKLILDCEKLLSEDEIETVSENI
ncbi:MAG: Chemotaxis protein CheW [bacterium ADurb.Bin363]|nr:MAG: Chemotaxis protein CheW [bacterium ADurb.Bin363]